MEFLTLIPSVLSYGKKAILRLKESREEDEERRFLEGFRWSRQQSNSHQVFEVEIGSEDYELCERMVRKGKLVRSGTGAYCLPDNYDKSDAAPEQLS